jgi:hypothetical protein
MRQEITTAAEHYFGILPKLRELTEGVLVYGVKIPKEYVFGFDAWCKDHKTGIVNPIGAQVITEEENAEVRTAMIRLYGFDNFIKYGGGKLVLEGQVNDWTGAIYELEFNKRKMHYLKMINRTIEPGSEKLTEEQRISSGLTKDGYKIYVKGIPLDEWKSIADAVAWTFGANKQPDGSYQFNIRGTNYGLYQPDVEA